MDDKDVRLINTLRAAYGDWLETLDVPPFKPLVPACAPSPLVAGGLTVIAQGVAQGKISPNELMQRLGPWLPGYLRRAGVDEGRADDFLAFVVEHLGELRDRRFRDVLPEWLAAFAGRAGAEINTAYTAAEATDIALRRPDPEEPRWALDVRAHLRTIRLQRPEDLLSATVPEPLRAEPALPAFLRSLYGDSLSLMHLGNETFELVAAA